MYVQRLTYYPAPGKGPELRPLLEERVKTGQASGQAVSLAQQMFGGQAGNPYVLNVRHQDLAAVEAFRRRNQSDPAVQALTAKIVVLLSRNTVIELFETLIPFPATPVMKAPYFAQRAMTYPAVGKGPEIRPIMEERVKSLQSSGQRASLGTLVYGSDGPLFTTTLSFQDLASLESYRRRNQGDPAFQAFGAKVNPLVRQAPKVELTEVLIPIPS